jgi:hypothetical protein
LQIRSTGLFSFLSFSFLHFSLSPMRRPTPGFGLSARARTRVFAVCVCVCVSSPRVAVTLRVLRRRLCELDFGVVARARDRLRRTLIAREAPSTEIKAAFVVRTNATEFPIFLAFTRQTTAERKKTKPARQNPARSHLQRPEDRG